MSTSLWLLPILISGYLFVRTFKLTLWRQKEGHEFFVYVAVAGFIICLFNTLLIHLYSALGMDWFHQVIIEPIRQLIFNTLSNLMNQPAAFKYQNLVSLCLLSIISARIWAFIANSLIYALAALEVFQSMVQAIQPNQRRFKSRIYPALKELWYGKLEFINLVRSVAITKEYRKQNELYGLLLDVLVQPYFILVNLDNNKCYIGEPTFINNQFHNPSDQFIRLQLYASGYRNNKQQLILQHFYSEEADSLKIGVNQIVINLDKVHSVSYFDPLLYQQHLQLRQKESQIKQTPMEVI